MDKVRERLREPLLFQCGSDRRRLAVDQKCCGEFRHVLELGKVLLGEPRLAARHGIAVAGVDDGRCQEDAERQPRAVGLRRLKRQHPAADGARHGERRERPARRDGLVLAIKLQPRLHPGGTRRHDGAHAAGRLADEPEAVAAEMIHVRVDGGDRRRHGHHRFQRVAAFGEDRTAGFHGAEMRRADDAAAMAGTVQIHGFQFATAGSSNPRLRSSASALGNRPRNFL